MLKARLPLLTAALFAVLAGCQSTTPESGQVSALRLGSVDIMRVMEEKPETVQIKLDWATQAGRTYTELANVKDKAAYDELQKQIAQQSQAWQKRMDEFVEKSVAEVEIEAEKLARERGLDIIVVDNTLTKTLKYTNGQDLTTDILIRLQNGGQ